MVLELLLLADVDKADAAYRDNERPGISGILKDLVVDPAKRDSALIGGAAGLGTAGATYAGLEAIPALRKRRGLRLLLAMLAGVPAGIYVGDKAGVWGADHRAIQGLLDATKNQSNLEAGFGKLKNVVTKHFPNI